MHLFSFLESSSRNPDTSIKSPSVHFCHSRVHFHPCFLREQFHPLYWRVSPSGVPGRERAVYLSSELFTRWFNLSCFNRVFRLIPFNFCSSNCIQVSWCFTRILEFRKPFHSYYLWGSPYLQGRYYGLLAFSVTCVLYIVYQYCVSLPLANFH